MQSVSEPERLTYQPTQRPPHETDRISRRDALKSTLAWAGASVLLNRGQRASGFLSANDRPRVAAIGTGSRWYIRATGYDADYGSAPEFKKYGNYVAVCDVDSDRQQRAADYVKQWSSVTPQQAADYSRIIERNFFESVVDRREPISDVASHHRALSTCHLAGIAARLGRTIHWDPKLETIVDDAMRWLKAF